MNQIRRLLELEYYWGEYLADGIIGDSEPGPVWRFFFRAPVYLYAWGLHGLVSRNVLLITTQGRKTGKPRTTPVGYLFDAASETYYLVAGWKGKTNWYRNALAQPEVRITVGGLTFDGVATRATDETVAKHLAVYAQQNPFAERLYLSLTGISSDGKPETLLKMAPFYPTMVVRRDSIPADSSNRPLGKARLS
jgi:deazaflavin-dependent oxidoreductase (nitroreductase family)